MGIQLDWQIDADNKPNERLHEEDNNQRKDRFRRLFKLLLFLGGISAIGAVIVFFVLNRLDEVNMQLENLLADTVRAEVTALRIGDAQAFLNLQRSASADWALAQEAEFNRYQALKTTTNLQLTGRVDNVTIDGQRGRVQVEEIIDGVPYLRTWFYWRYDAETINTIDFPSGWYRVPPDFTFWGTSDQLEARHFITRYHTLDKPFAEQFNATLEIWFTRLCQLTNCANLPPVTFDIIANNMPEPTWTQEQTQWQMVVPSPYVGRARADMPFNPQRQISVATLIADRFVTTFIPAPNYPADAFYLRSSIASWLVGQFAQINTNAFLIDSLITNYGHDTLAQLLQNLQADSSMAIFAEIAPSPLAEANLDWRDLLTWRLVTESDLIARNDQNAFLSLYDMRLPDTATLAYDRFAQRIALESPVVVHAERNIAPDGTPQLNATVQTRDGNQQIVLFNLVNNTWLRAN